MTMVNTARKQRGVATLVTAVVLMLAVFGITFYMSEVVVNEKRITANQIRGKQAFYAAQAGIERAVQMILGGGGPVCPIASGTLSSGSFEVCVSLTDEIYQIESTGWSGDSSVRRSLTQSIAKLPPDTAPPNVPVIARGTVNIGGNARITNNLSDITVWSGEDFDPAGGNSSFDTYINVDGQDDVLSTTGTTRGPDIIDNDQNLAQPTVSDPSIAKSNIMNAFFNIASVYDIGELDSTKSFDEAKALNASGLLNKSTYDYVYFAPGTASGLTSSSVENNQLLEASDFDDYEANCGSSSQCNTDEILEFAELAAGGAGNASTILGTPDEPVVLAIDDDFSFTSNLVVFGILLTDGSITNLNGGVTVFGGVISLEDSDLTGGPDIYLDKTIIQNSTLNEDYGPVKSSWKDW